MNHFLHRLVQKDILSQLKKIDLKKYIINLFGTSYRILECSISDDQFIQFDIFCQKHQIDWEDFFNDYDVLNHFNINKWTDFSNSAERILYPLTARNKVEIKEKNKFILKIYAEELLNQNSLFELYNSKIYQYQSEIKKEHKSFLIIQEETGLNAKFEIDTSIFDINKLAFNYYQDFVGLQENNLFEITYDNQLLKNLKEDTVVRSLRVHWLK